MSFVELENEPRRSLRTRLRRRGRRNPAREPKLSRFDSESRSLPVNL